MKKTLLKILSFTHACTLFGCGSGNQTAVHFEESDIPDASWQLDTSFPDCLGYVSFAQAVNNRIWFYGYEDQGELYLQPDDACNSFRLFINEKEIPINGVEPGKSYRLDFSDMAVNGRNTLQISELETGSVNVYVPYPVVKEGEVFSKQAFDLIDQIITADIENGFSSAQLAVVKDGKLVYEHAWGNVRTYDEKGNPVESEPVTTNTLYDLASVTKVFSVNYALQYLLTNEEIDLNTKITDILGDEFAEDTISIEYEGYPAVPLKTVKEWKASLTIADLLTHQGGFPPGPHYYSDRYDNASQKFNSDLENVLYVGTGCDEAARTELLHQIFRTPLMYEPRTVTMYSDVDYIVLCYCIEKITGKRLDEYLKEVFWQPMGLTHITYNPLENGFSKSDCAATELMGNSRDGHVRYTGIRQNVIQGEVHDPIAWFCMQGVSGHAGLFANAGDLAKLASVMLSGGYGSNRYFSNDVIDLFTSPKSASDPYYGYGWWRDADHWMDRYFGSVTSSNTYGHQGFTGTMTMIDPENDLVIVLLTNMVHSQILEGDETLSNFNGSFYTTATLGFVPEILQIALENPSDDQIYYSLLSDMILESKHRISEEGISDENHPRMKALHALDSVLESFGRKN